MQVILTNRSTTGVPVIFNYDDVVAGAAMLMPGIRTVVPEKVVGILIGEAGTESLPANAQTAEAVKFFETGWDQTLGRSDITAATPIRMFIENCSTTEIAVDGPTVPVSIVGKMGLEVTAINLMTIQSA